MLLISKLHRNYGYAKIIKLDQIIGSMAMKIQNQKLTDVAKEDVNTTTTKINNHKKCTEAESVRVLVNSFICQDL